MKEHRMFSKQKHQIQSSSYPPPTDQPSVLKEQTPFKDIVLAELCYAYHARPQEEFRLSGAGKQALWVFDSLLTKKIADLPEVNNYEIRVTGIDYNSNDVFLYNTVW